MQQLLVGVYLEPLFFETISHFVTLYTYLPNSCLKCWNRPFFQKIKTVRHLAWIGEKATVPNPKPKTPKFFEIFWATGRTFCKIFFYNFRKNIFQVLGSVTFFGQLIIVNGLCWQRSWYFIETYWRHQQLKKIYVRPKSTGIYDL